jgi:alpha-N-arabinofuranosidase
VPEDDWPFAPRIAEDAYTVTDAVVVGTLLITLLRHSDRVTAACQAQLVNALAPIHTEPGGAAWRLPSFYPFAHAARHARGSVLRVDADSPHYDSATHGETSVLHSVATHDPDTGEVVVFAVNRSTEEDLELRLGVRAFPDHRVVEHLVLAHDDLAAVNTVDRQDRVVPRRVDQVLQDGDDGLRVRLAPVSWNVIRLQPPDGK